MWNRVMKKYLVLLAGPPATGKSYLVRLIRKALPQIYTVSPDEFKEDMAESVGFDNLQEKVALEKQVWSYYYQALELYMSVGKQFIVTEYPFSFKQKKQLQDLSQKHDYSVITIRLVADFEVLWQRRMARDLADDRHLSFIMTHFHHSDRLSDRRLADDLITKEDFQKIIEDRKYNDFSLGTLYEIDVTDFAKVDYKPLIDELLRLSNE